MDISKNGRYWHLEAFLCYFTCLNLIFVKILSNFQLGHHYYCLTVTGHCSLQRHLMNMQNSRPSTLQYTTIIDEVFFDNFLVIIYLLVVLLSKISSESFLAKFTKNHTRTVKSFFLYQCKSA
jgi:hypothetical protein